MSNKVRVYELAKQTGLETKEVLRRLDELGITATTASSSVLAGDALRFKEALGTTAEERQKAEEEARRKEQEELERYKQMEVKKPASGKAKKVLPPHLRKQQEEQEAAEQAAAAARDRAAASATADDTADAGDADEPSDAEKQRATPKKFKDVESSTDGEESDDTTASAPAAKTDSGSGARRMPGAPPPKIKKGEAPLRPKVVDRKSVV